MRNVLVHSGVELMPMMVEDNLHFAVLVKLNAYSGRNPNAAKGGCGQRRKRKGAAALVPA